MTGTHDFHSVKHLQRAYAASEARFQAVVGRSADGVIVLDMEGTIVLLNQAAEKLLGRSQQELVGTLLGVPMVPGESTELDMVRNGAPAGVAEMRVVQTEWQGEPAYLATLRDITPHKQAEQAAQQAVRRRDQFLATVSHELRNPLAAIVNAAELLGQPSVHQQAMIRAKEVLLRQCRQMTGLLDDMLDVSRISQGKIELRKEIVSLTGIISDDVPSARSLMESHGIRLHVRLDDEPLYVDGEAVRLHQIVMNLLTNAAKYTDAGGQVWLDLQRHADQAVVRVSDTGAGIAPDMLEAIFQPFVQAAPAHQQAASGLGIGLALVQSLVQLHGGQVTASSPGPGQGSQFVVRLPLASRPAVPRLPPPSPTRCRPLRILIVEDNADVREMLQTLLELENHQIQTTGDGLRAIEMLQQDPPELALVDIGLPGCNGYQVARQTRANPHLQDTYLVALTGYGQSADRRQALQSGFDTHLVKPLDMKQLLALLAERASLTHT